MSGKLTGGGRERHWDPCDVRVAEIAVVAVVVETGFPLMNVVTFVAVEDTAIVYVSLVSVTVSVDVVVLIKTCDKSLESTILDLENVAALPKAIRA